LNDITFWWLIIETIRVDYMLGISTCWCSKRVSGGEEIAKDILELGLEGVELEYRIRSVVFREMKPYLHKALKVLSVHNYFPLPDDMPLDKASGDLFLLSSPDEDERSKAVAYSIKTIEHARDLGARAVVFHLGKVDMPDPTQDFFRLFRDGMISEKERLGFIGRQRRLRLASRGKNLDAVLVSLEVLNKEAVKRGILLGIENRFHFHEVPDFEEIGHILREFKGGNIRYWHDVGHARVQENLGCASQEELLEAYSGEMAGIHLHDVRGLDDHLAPGQGEVDFDEIKPFLRPSMIKILEVHSRVPQEEVLQGIRRLRKIFQIAN
jgi:sugar phosphate isomerase/epimerase